MAREELATMTDQELLAYQREHHDDPDMTLEKATEMQRLALHCWASGAAYKKADRVTQEETRLACIRSCFRATPLSLSQRVNETGKRHDDGSFT